MGKAKSDVLQGTLDLLILKALELEAMHGWAISERLQQISRDVIQVQQGSLYPALHRLERRSWIKANWAVSELTGGHELPDLERSHTTLSAAAEINRGS